MKFITEQYIRDVLKDKKLVEFHVPHDKILSPAAKDYLNQVRVRVCFDSPEPEKEAGGGRKYIDAFTGEVYKEKPECMTHLKGNELVFKDNERIIFRGELDHLQSQIVYAQASLDGTCSESLISDLEDVLVFVRNLMRAEVLDEPFGVDFGLLGLDSAALREQSHHPDKYFGVRAMTLPHYKMGKAYALLNLLRSQSRQAETAAVQAFRDERVVSRPDVVEALNRLSSGFHILCCRVLSNYYCTEGDT
ncbi:MAG: ATP-binding protein [Oscillospiraceae bacterium]|nr:ATP-binding protein [Oscillospiraceae bacterium]